MASIILLIGDPCALALKEGDGWIAAHADGQTLLALVTLQLDQLLLAGPTSKIRMLSRTRDAWKLAVDDHSTLAVRSVSRLFSHIHHGTKRFCMCALSLLL